MNDIIKIFKEISIRLNSKWYWEFQSVHFWEWIEKEDSRIYFAWDPSNKINWKLTAKSWTLMVNKELIESTMSFKILFDTNINWNTWFSIKFFDSVFEILDIFQQKLNLKNARSDIFFNNYWELYKSNLKFYEVHNIKTKIGEFIKNYPNKINIFQNKKYFSVLTNFLKRNLETRNTIFLIFTDMFGFDKENLEFISYLNQYNFVWNFILEVYEQGENFEKFYINFDKKNILSNKLNYTLIK